jgi:hypothetical protein
LTKPKAVIEAFHRRAFADVDVVILRRRDGGCVPAIATQRREAQRLVAMLFVNAEKPQRRHREQFIDTGLNVRAHVARELPRGRG